MYSVVLRNGHFSQGHTVEALSEHGAYEDAYGAMKSAGEKKYRIVEAEGPWLGLDLQKIEDATTAWIRVADTDEPLRPATAREARLYREHTAQPRSGPWMLQINGRPLACYVR